MPHPWTPTDRLIGIWSAVSVPVIGLLYITCGAIGILLHGDLSLDALLPAEPYLTICRVLMILAIIALVTVFAAVHAYAEPDRKTSSRLAVVFAGVFATITLSNNILLLTVARGFDADPTLARLLEFRWPSAIFVLELLGWGPVRGLALLFAAPVFRGGKLQTAICSGMVLAGLLCLGNVLCFFFGDPRFSALGIIGYDFVVPIVCVLLGVLFVRCDTPSCVPSAPAAQ
jgi:hypothetical protein